MPSLSTDAHTLVEDLIRHEVEDKSIPSISYALVDRDGLLAEGLGHRHNRHYPIREDTCFRIGSITKSFTSVSYTHLEVYKRQPHWISPRCWASASTLLSCWWC